MSSPASDPNAWQLNIVRCPISGERLFNADAVLLQRLNRHAARGELRTRGGEVVPAPLTGGLVTASSGGWFYRESDHTLLLLPEQAIPLDSLPAGIAAGDR